MRGQRGPFDVDDRLKRLSDLGDQLEAFRAAVDFAIFRPELEVALAYSDGAQGERPLFERFDATLRQAGYIAMSGQIVDASLIAAPRQRNSASTQNPASIVIDSRQARTRRLNQSTTAAR